MPNIYRERHTERALQPPFIVNLDATTEHENDKN